MAYRGLTLFISDLRNCQTREQEQLRVEKEMANIRSKFADPHLDAYHREKYVWKMLYMFMLGYEVDFGHMEAVNLCTQNTYKSKSVGYMACTLLFNENMDLLRLIIQAIKNDLTNTRQDSTREVFQCLALTVIANVGGQEFAESLTPDVQKLLVAGTSRPAVKKKAALCLLRLFRKYPDVIPTDLWAPRLITLLDDPHYGVLLSVLSLLLGLVSRDPRGYEDCVPKCINMLHKIAYRGECERDYIYHIPCPWLQVKLLKLLQYFAPPSDSSLIARLTDALNKILTLPQVPLKPINKSNVIHAVIFEAANLIIHLSVHG